MKRLFHSKISPVLKMKTSDIHFIGSKDPARRTLFLILVSGAGIFFIILLIKLFTLTVVKGDYYRRLSEANRIREIPIEPKYGTIRDRKGFVIAENKDVVISATQEYIRSERSYYFAEETAHLIGYRQLADKKDIETDYCPRKLLANERVGKKGVEKLFDCDLRGTPGKKLIEVNASGKKEGIIAVIPPIDGKSIQLALDVELQRTAFQALKGKRGVVIAMNPTTGEILTFVSSPSYDPTFFEKGDMRVSELFNNKEKPLLNRITEGVYPPGSIFKPIIAAGALEDGSFTDKTIVQDDGFVMAGTLRFGNWYYLQYGKTEGPVDMLKAIQRSNDTYFYKLGEKMGPERMQTWAEKFGLGTAINIGFDEAEGTLPSPFWKSEVLHERWYLGDTYNYSIGQGYLSTTPLQMAYALAPFANNGYQCEPQLLKGIPPECKKLPLKQSTLDLIKEGMKRACSTGGTGWPLFDFKVKNTELFTKDLEKVSNEKKASAEASMNKDIKYFKPIQTSCKTGTAESHAKSGIPHAWAEVFAPAEKPEIAITVLVEEAGQGSDVAIPIARDILKTYFERVQ
ncbi:MAG: penicillin-binding transpeptidase domain-containing protein [Candidatus Roizmanbacteria bacterium]|nr:penicillin-binding transpeptidase domain-containing protein [Candidatus Roizmanbacteria bacterium]